MTQTPVLPKHRFYLVDFLAYFLEAFYLASLGSSMPAYSAFYSAVSACSLFCWMSVALWSFMSACSTLYPAAYWSFLSALSIMIDPTKIISSTQSGLLHMNVCSITNFELPLFNHPLGADFRFFIGDSASCGAWLRRNGEFSGSLSQRIQ